MSLCAQVHCDRRSAYEPAKPPYLRRFSAALGRFQLLRIREQAQAAEPIGTAAHLRALIIVAGNPQSGRGDQHVVGPQPATAGVEPSGACRIQHEVAGLWIKASQTWRAEAAGAERIATVRVAGEPLVPADVDGRAIG